MNINKLKCFYDTKSIKLLLIIIFILSVFNCFNIPKINMPFENKILFYISTSLYQMVVIIIMYVYSLKLIKTYDFKDTITLRFSSKENYLKKIISITTINNLLIFVIFEITGIFLLLIINFKNINFGFYENYQIPFALYNIFISFKYFCIMNIICSIGIILYKGFGVKFSLLYFLLILLLKDNCNYSIDVINDFKMIKLFYGYYLYPFLYSSLSLEICAFSIIMCVLLSIKEFLYYYIVRKVPIKVGE